MRTDLVPLIDAHHTTGDARVEHAGLAQQLEALHPHSFGWAMACCDRRREDAEDVLHDVYMMVLSGDARFEGRSTLKTWLFGVIRRTAASRRRRDLLHSVLGMRIDRPAPPSTPEEDVVTADRRARTRSAISRLSARQRQVLQLVFYHDTTIEEAATIMNVSIGSARTHYHRGKARMAAMLSADRQ
jgi:RNA polymerase sigma-70 factor (ECF subfamily)